MIRLFLQFVDDSNPQNVTEIILLSFFLSGTKKIPNGKSQDIGSFEEKPEEQAAEKRPEPIKPQPEVKVQISTEEMKKKHAAKKDEDPKITKFKNAEVKSRKL